MIPPVKPQAERERTPEMLGGPRLLYGMSRRSAPGQGVDFLAAGVDGDEVVLAGFVFDLGLVVLLAAAVVLDDFLDLAALGERADLGFHGAGGAVEGDAFARVDVA